MQPNGVLQFGLGVILKTYASTKIRTFYSDFNTVFHLILMGMEASIKYSTSPQHSLSGL